MPDEEELSLTERILMMVSEEWDPPEGMEVTNRYGEYVEAVASVEALEQIEKDPSVLTYEKHISGGRFS